MNFHKLLGQQLSVVEEIMTNAEIKYIIRETHGFKDKEILNEARIIKISEIDNIVELVISYFSSPLN